MWLRGRALAEHVWDPWFELQHYIKGKKKVLAKVKRHWSPDALLVSSDTATLEHHLVVSQNVNTEFHVTTQIQSKLHTQWVENMSTKKVYMTIHSIIIHDSQEVKATPNPINW
jgi:hypothetical protein